MRQGTIEIALLIIAFLMLQIWWITKTIKNGRTGEVDKWGKLRKVNSADKLDEMKKELEKLFKS